MQLGCRFSFAFKAGFKRMNGLGVGFFVWVFFFFFSLFEASTSKAASAARLQVLGAEGGGHVLRGAGGALDLWMWHFRTWLSRQGGVGLAVGPDDLRGLFQP